MSDTEKVEFLATEVMGWSVDRFNQASGRLQTKMLGTPFMLFLTREWNPLTDWNHTMQVVDALAPQRGFHLFTYGSKAHWQIQFGDGRGEFYNYEVTEEKDRRAAVCRAAYLAFQSIP